MIRITLLTCALVAPLWATASDEPVPLTASEMYAEIARWMIEQPEPVTRAAGLLALASDWVSGEASIEPARFLEEAETMLRDKPSGAVAYMLARGCAAVRLLERCEAIGVRDAVDEYDGGNPLAAGPFHETDSAGYRDMLLDATNVDDHYPEFVAAWFEALRARPPDGMPEDAELICAVGMAMAIVVPSMQDLMRRCRAAVGSDESLDRACQRLSQQLRASGRTVFLRNMGYGLARQRAEARGNQALAERLREQNLAVSLRTSCLPESANQALSSNAEVQRRFLSDLRARGEIAAFEALIDQYGSTCEE